MEPDRVVKDKVQCRAGLVAARVGVQAAAVDVYVRHAVLLYRIKGVFPVFRAPVLNAVQR